MVLPRKRLQPSKVPQTRRQAQKRKQSATEDNMSSSNKRRAVHTATSTVQTDDLYVQSTSSNNRMNVNITELVNTITSTVTAELSSKVRDTVLATLQSQGLTTQSSDPGLSTDNVTLQMSNESIRATVVPEHSDCPITDLQIPASQGVASFQVQTSLSETPKQYSQNCGKGFQSATLPLHSFVALKIKEKIWNSEFIDLSTAFNDKAEDESKFSLSFDKSGSTKITQKPKKKFITIEQWTDSFAKFASVLRLKYPDLADPLAQYSSTVRGIAKAKGNWYYYDTQFRKLKQNVDIPWDCIQHELYFKALNQKQQPFRSLQGFGQKPSTQGKSCYKYNNGDHCEGCIYPHVCRICGGRHPRFKCFKRNQLNQPSISSGGTMSTSSSGGTMSTSNTAKTVTSSNQKRQQFK